MSQPATGSVFCVINMQSGSILYTGRSIAMAAVALEPGTHFEWGDTWDEARGKAFRAWEARSCSS